VTLVDQHYWSLWLLAFCVVWMLAGAIRGRK
jgi:hypothetical protein